MILLLNKPVVDILWIEIKKAIVFANKQGINSNHLELLLPKINTTTTINKSEAYILINILEKSKLALTSVISKYKIKLTEDPIKYNIYLERADATLNNINSTLKVLKEKLK